MINTYFYHKSSSSGLYKISHWDKGLNLATIEIYSKRGLCGLTNYAVSECEKYFADGVWVKFDIEEMMFKLYGIREKGSGHHLINLFKLGDFKSLDLDLSNFTATEIQLLNLYKNAIS